MAETRIAKYNKRLQLLKTERSVYMPLWGELADFHMTHRGRFLVNDSQKKGHKRNTKQFNNHSRMAARTQASGMMAGITSPSRPWFKLGSGDTALNDYGPVRLWLASVEALMYRIFAASNIYNCLHSIYTEMGVFGTGALGVYQDYDNVVRAKCYTIGSYLLGAGANDLVDTFYREYMRTVGQLVKEFGKENCSLSVVQMWQSGNTEHEVQVVHVIEPNDDRDHMSPLARDMRWRSVYYESSAGSGTADKFLRESGFEDFPIMAPRWDVVGEEVYSNDCPGMIALGDTKALQLGEKRLMQAVDKVSNPALQADAGSLSALRGQQPEPGEIIILPQNSKGFSSIYGNYSPDLNAIGEGVIARAEHRISRAFFEDLFMMLANSDRRQITAREVAEKHEEKLLQLGPVLDRTQHELLDPLIDRVFNIVLRAGLVSTPPRELQGRELVVEYISVMAQAQRMVGIGGLERTVGFAANIAAIWPEARFKIDAMQSVDEYSVMMGVSPRVIRSDDDAEAMAGEEAQAAAQSQGLQQATMAADMVRNASEASLEGESALTATLRNAGLQ